MPTTATRKKSAGKRPARKPRASKKRRTTVKWTDAPAAESNDAEPARPRTEKKSPPPLLAELGVFGLNSIESVVVAALISGEPLLLIGPHGTAKSYLLNRITQALGLESRHYNASLLNFDDLVGYPLPGDDGSLKYVQTPSSIWGAEAVFLDEISRCRIDLQNKLFPIIHERRVQCIELEKLVYRWSAMNPPGDDSEEDRLESYRGSEPLDIALADRFAFVVQMPDWNTQSADDQHRIILAGNDPPTEAVSQKLRRLVETGQRLMPEVRRQIDDRTAAYVRTVVKLLGDAGISLSPRRGGILLRNIAAVHVSQLLTGAATDPAESALVALYHSIPQRAAGQQVDELKLLAAHREAWTLTKLEPTDPRRLVLGETDPVKRSLLAIEFVETLPETEFSAIVADAIAALPYGGRHALATAIFESGAAAKLVAAVADQCGWYYSMVATPQEFKKMVVGDGRHKTWDRIVQLLSEMKKNKETTLLTNLLVSLYKYEEVFNDQGVDLTLESWRTIRELTRGGRS
ncbi:MAG: MoxR family ATPase [Pirellulales bacterium]